MSYLDEFQSQLDTGQIKTPEIKNKMQSKLNQWRHEDAVWENRTYPAMGILFIIFVFIGSMIVCSMLAIYSTIIAYLAAVITAALSGWYLAGCIIKLRRPLPEED